MVERVIKPVWFMLIDTIISFVTLADGAVP